MEDVLTIGELATRAGLSRDTIRFYEREALLPAPARTSTGYRLYPPEMVERLHFIKRAQALGFSLGEIKPLLDGYQDAEECVHVKRLLEQKFVELGQKLREIQTLRDILSRYLGKCQQALQDGSASTACPVLQIIHDPATFSS